MESQLRPEHLDIVKDYVMNANSHSVSHYMLTVARDGESPARTIIFYENAVEAAEAYSMYVDWGFAKQYLTVCLYEPSGKINQKVFNRNQAGEPTFIRQNYIDVSREILKLRPLLDMEVYEGFCMEVTKSFSKDNWRFDPERFLRDLGVGELTDAIPV